MIGMGKAEDIDPFSVESPLVERTFHPTGFLKFKYTFYSTLNLKIYIYPNFFQALSKVLYLR